MKRFSIEYAAERVSSPMSFWVHRALNGAGWATATEFSPPLPGPVPGRGYPLYVVEFKEVQLRFASRDELAECIDVLARRVLPTTRQLSERRGTGAGPNSHWLSRLPSRLKPWRTRQVLTRYLRSILVSLGAGATPQEERRAVVAKGLRLRGRTPT